MGDNEKAKLLENRYSKQCDICFLLDTESAEMKFHLYEEAVYHQDTDKYICDQCLKDLREIRKRCHQKIDNSKIDILKGFQMTFAVEMLKAQENKDKK